MLAPARLCLAVPVLISVVCTAALFAFGWNGWPGTVGSSGMEFCEALADGLIKQPANTWSNLAFMFAGVWVGYSARAQLSNRQRDTPINRMTTEPLYPILYAGAAALVGPMSMALHASTTTWGGKIDVMSMFAWAAFCLMYAVTRLRDLDRTTFLRGYVAVLTTLTAVFLVSPFYGSGSALFGAAIVAFGAVELWICWQRPDRHADVRWLAASAGLFGLALFVWTLSHTGRVWCDPSSLLQGHALWHVLNGAAMVTVYRFFSSEPDSGSR